jgi:3-oxoacyl-[acyl-carrier-protein] synthase I
MSRCGILSTGCSSSAGPSVDAFWTALQKGIDHARPTPGFISSVCSWHGSGPTAEQDSAPSSTLDLLVRHLTVAWKDCLTRVPHQNTDFRSQRLGVILASTKGCIDDWVWKQNPDLPELNGDPYVPVLEKFLAISELAPVETICVSNACASSLTAILLGREWLRQDRVDHVLVLAVDRAGPFVRKGFETLKVVSSSKSRPFAKNRDGLCLGDAAAAILLSREGGVVEIEAVATDTEGYAVTRPTQSGASLKRACMAVGAPGIVPDLIIAHGTGTIINDQVEDGVMHSLFGDRRIPGVPPGVPTTGTKWSIGHTLAVSAAMDLIAGCEVLRTQKVFKLANTEQVDPQLRGRYLTANEPLVDGFHAERVLISSLGFGGVHAALMLKKGLKSSQDSGIRK